MGLTVRQLKAVKRMTKNQELHGDKKKSIAPDAKKRAANRKKASLPQPPSYIKTREDKQTYYKSLLKSLQEGNPAQWDADQKKYEKEQRQKKDDARQASDSRIGRAKSWGQKASLSASDKYRAARAKKRRERDSL